MTTIAPQNLHGRSEAFDLIDVRSPGEYGSVHAEGAVSLPLDRVTPEAVIALRRHSGPLYVICHSGARGRAACEKLIAAGLTNVVNVEGGTMAWEKAGLPVVRTKSLKATFFRFARPVAITTMILCAVLAWVIHPAFLLGIVAVWAGMTAIGMCPIMAILFPRKATCPITKT